MTSNGQGSPSEALAENRTPSTLAPYWDIDDVDDNGSKPSELYGKETWTFEKFSENIKREHRSKIFEVGGGNWCIIINPQGFDVSNYLSVCLCVAYPNKLLPGWSRLAQFTITVVNKDSKKSKFSDTLNRFSKKDQAWGQDKFMELSQLQEGFIDDSGSLTIQVQVQVIRERVDRPFRCLHTRYRWELVGVYLKYVEKICWEFIDEKRSKFGNLIADKAKWESLCAFWIGLDQNTRRRMSQEKQHIVLKEVVNFFFIEKKVSSTLTMDSLYSGLKALEGQRLTDRVDLPGPVVTINNKDMFLLADDIPLLLERTARGPLPLNDERDFLSRMKNVEEEFTMEAIESIERHLTELARSTLEMFILHHIFSNKIEVSYRDAIALKLQEELIREEEEAWLKKGTTPKEKKSKNRKKGKEKKREVKVRTQAEEKGIEKKDYVRVEAESSAEKPVLGKVSDAKSLSSETEDKPSRKASSHKNHSHASEVHKVEEAAAAISPIREPGSPVERTPVSKDHDTVSMQKKSVAVLSSPIAALRNLSSLVLTKPEKFATKKLMSVKFPPPVQASPSRDTQLQIVEPRADIQKIVSLSPAAEPTTSISRQLSAPIIPPKQASLVRVAPSHLSSLVQAKPEKKVVTNVDHVPERKLMSAKSPPSVQASPSRDTQLQTVSPRADIQKTASSKPAAKPTPSISRPLSASVIPPKQASPVVPPKEASPVIPPKQASPVIPQKQASPIIPPKQASPVIPPKQASPGTSVVQSLRKPVFDRSPPSVQASPSRDIQLQTVGPRADIQKTAASKPAAKPTPSILRPLSAPVIPPKQASPVVPPKEASPVIPPKQASPVIPQKQASPVTAVVQTLTASGATSLSSAGRSAAYILQSYKHAIVGSSGISHSSSQSTGVSTLPPYSHPSPISGSSQSRFPINVGSSNVSSGGFVWTGGSTSDSRTSGNHGMNQYNNPVIASTRPTDVQMGRATQSPMIDDYPHLDMINDLLDEGHGMMDSSVYHVPQASNNQYMYHGGVDMRKQGGSNGYRDFWPSNGH